jgi:hypothetical protein
MSAPAPMLPLQRYSQMCRAIEAAHAVDEVKDIRDKALRDTWIFQARRDFSPGEQLPCAICGKYRLITHAHHRLPLAFQYQNGIMQPIQDFLWLCPNHHAMIHVLLNNAMAKGSDNSIKHVANILSECGCSERRLLEAEIGLFIDWRMRRFRKTLASGHLAFDPEAA